MLNHFKNKQYFLIPVFGIIVIFTYIFYSNFVLAAPAQVSNTGFSVGSGGTLYYTQGRVGIGDRFPSAMLDVVRRSLSDDLLTLSTTSSANGNLMTVKSGGNVGIGVINPIQKLEVAGTIKATRFIGDGSGLTNIPSQWQGVGDISYTKGKIGVGVARPRTALDISGALFVNDICDENGENCRDISAGWAETQNKTTSLPTFLRYNNNLYYIDGNVGVGTSNPKSLLDVAGRLQVKEVCDENGQNCKTISSGWGGADENLVVSGNSLSFKQNIINIGSITNAGVLNVSGIVQSAQFIGDGSKLTGLPSSPWSQKNNNLFYSLGNVGLGTDAPLAALDVVGDIRVNKICGRDGVNCLDLTKPTIAQNQALTTLIFDSQTGNLSLQPTTIANTSPVNLDGRYLSKEIDPKIGENVLNRVSRWSGTALITSNIYSDGTRVGIGTDTPNRILHLKTSPGINAEIDLQSGNNSYWGIYNDELSNDLRFWKQGVGSTGNVLTLNSLGQVIVGDNISSVNPALNIIGRLKIQGGNPGAGKVLMSDNAGFASWETLNQSGQTLSFDPSSRTLSLGNGVSVVIPESDSITKSGNHLAGGNIGLNNYWLSGDGGNEGVFVDALGNVGIGTNQPAEKLHVAGNIKADTILCPSDARLKNNIKTLDDDTLTKVLKLRPTSFIWNKNGESDLGFIAQEVEKIYPELVVTDLDGYKSLKYDKLTAPLVGAIQEQQQEIELLKQQVGELKKLLVR